MATTPDQPEATVHLLIVEDHELLAGTLALALRQEGLDVHTAMGPTAGAVVDLARELAPALVLLDLDLGPPLGDGLDLVPDLIATGARVVMVTGVTDKARLGACLEAGASGVVSKAAGFERLITAVQHAAAGRPVMADDDRLALLAETRAQRRAEDARLAPFRSLTPREQAVLTRLMAGESAETIASRSYVSLATVRSQIRAVLLKLGVNSQLAAVALARDAGWRATRPE